MSSIRTLALLTLLTALSLSGCSSLRQWRANGGLVGPNYRRPAAPVGEHWTDVEYEACAKASPVHADWWRVFQDPLLERLVLSAYQQNLPLRVAGLRVLEARAQRRLAGGNLWPQSQTSFGQFLRQQQSRNAALFIPRVVPGVPIPRAFDDWQNGFDLSWELDLWGRIRRQIESADASVQAAIDDYDQVLVTLLGDVAASYIEIRALDQRLLLAAKNIDVQQGSLDLATAREQRGRGTELDVQQAKANLADTRALVPALEQTRRLTLNRLAVLLGQPPVSLEPLLRDVTPIPTAPEQVVVGVPAELLRRRPDIRAAERRIAAQSAQIGVAEAELYPQFSLAGEIRLQSRNFSQLFSSGSLAGFVGPGFRWKILNYGRLTNNVRIQELGFQQRVVEYEQVVLQAQREVEDAMTQFLRAKERVGHLEDSAQAAARAAELVRLQYEGGEVDFGRVFVAEAFLVQRQDQLVDGQAQVALAVAKLYKALGGGWQLRCDTPYTGCGPLPQHDVRNAVDCRQDPKCPPAVCVPQRPACCQ